MYSKILLGLNAIFIALVVFLYLQNLELLGRVSKLESYQKNLPINKSVDGNEGSSESEGVIDHKSNSSKREVDHRLPTREGVPVYHATEVNELDSEDVAILIDDHQEVLNIHLEGKELTEIPEEFLPPKEDVISHQQQELKEALGQ